MAQRERILPWGELDEDGRTYGEQLKDLGVLPDTSDTVVATNAVWFPKSAKRGPYKRNWDISISKAAMTFTEKAYKVVGSSFFIPGIATIGDDTVLLINPTKDEKRGYKISFNGSYRVTAQGLVANLIAKGITMGKYKLVTASKGKFAAIPIKRSAN